jgi:MFS family permease
MVAANAVRAGLLGALVLALLTGADPLVALYLVAFGIGCSETAYDTSAQSILPQVVPRPALSRANGRLLAAELTANQFIGPPLGGALVVVGAACPLPSRPRCGSAPRVPCCSCAARSGWSGPGRSTSAPTSRRGCASCGAGRCCGPSQ